MSTRPLSGSIAIRAACDGDVPGIAAIYAFHVLNGFGSFEETPPTASEMLRRRQEVAGRDLPFLVAESGGPILGFAYAAPYRTRSAYRYTVEDSVYVAEEARRRRIGRSLLATLIEQCTARGYRQMVAVIGDAGNDASIGLHTALGFVPSGRLTAIGFKRGRWIDSVLMQRPLGPGSATPPPATGLTSAS